jgi:hypothetical protein
VRQITPKVQLRLLRAQAAARCSWLFERTRVFLRFNHIARVIVKLFCHARPNFPKERGKARNEFSMKAKQ